jgi:hypothetical protein
MKDHKTCAPPPAAILEWIHSHLAQAMTQYYSKRVVVGCSNRAGPHEDISMELANCLPAKNRSQAGLP